MYKSIFKKSIVHNETKLNQINLAHIPIINQEESVWKENAEKVQDIVHEREKKHPEG